MRQVFRTWDLNQQEFFERNWEREQNASGTALALNKMLSWWDEIYLQNEKFKRSL